MESGSASAVKTLSVGIKVTVREDFPLRLAMRVLRCECRAAGIRLGDYVRLADRNNSKEFFEKPGVKRRRKRALADKRRRRAEIDRGY